MQAPDRPGEAVAPRAVSALFGAGIELWQRMEQLGFEGIFFSEHHFGLS